MKGKHANKGKKNGGNPSKTREKMHHLRAQSECAYKKFDDLNDAIWEADLKAFKIKKSVDELKSKGQPMSDEEDGNDDILRDTEMKVNTRELIVSYIIIFCRPKIGNRIKVLYI
jgi:hypothetical protein